MIQWIIVAIILALCLLYIINRLRKRRKGGPCSNCGCNCGCRCCDTDCPDCRK